MAKTSRVAGNAAITSTAVTGIAIGTGIGIASTGVSGSATMIMTTTATRNC